MRLYPTLEAEFIQNIPKGWVDPENGRVFKNGGYRMVGDLQQADGVKFLCPKCYAEIGSRPGVHGVICWFVGRVADDVSPRPGRWTPDGTGLADLSFVPSPGRSQSVALLSGCMWHGIVVNGDAT